MNYPQTTLIWVITHTHTKHKDLLGFALNPNSITCNLTMNPTSKGGFHTLDPIRIYFRVGFLTTHNPTNMYHTNLYKVPYKNPKIHTRIHTFLLFPSSSLLLFFFSSSSSSSSPLLFPLYGFWSLKNERPIDIIQFLS